MKKFKFFLSFEKEEKWLDKMAEQGYLLEKKSFLYHFKNDDSANITFKIDYRKFKNNQDFIDYGMIFEDSGWKHVTGSKSSGFQYFKKINNDSDDDIFSDALSRAGRYKRISNMWLTYVSSEDDYARGSESLCITPKKVHSRCSMIKGRL